MPLENKQTKREFASKILYTLINQLDISNIKNVIIYLNVFDYALKEFKKN